MAAPIDVDAILDAAAIDADPDMLIDATLAAEAPPRERFAAAARVAEARARPGRAIDLWKQARDTPGAAIFGSTARERIAFLEARRDADGSLDGWQALEEVRRLYRHRPLDTSRDDVIALLGREGIAEATGWEARLWLARTALVDRKDPQEAHDLAKGLWDDRDRLPDWVRQRAGITYARSLARLGRWQDAFAVEALFAVPTAPGGERLTPVGEEQRAVLRLARRQAAVGVAGLGAAALVGAALVARRRPPRPDGLVAILVVSALAWALAEGWEAGAGRAVPALAAAWTALHLASVAALAAPRPVWAAALLRAVAAAATLGAGYAILDAYEQLEWMGW